MRIVAQGARRRHVLSSAGEPRGSQHAPLLGPELAHQRRLSVSRRHWNSRKHEPVSRSAEHLPARQWLRFPSFYRGRPEARNVGPATQR